MLVSLAVYVFCRAASWQVWHDHTCQAADAPGFLDVPAQVQCQPVGTVEWVLLMREPELGNGCLVAYFLFCWYCVQTSSANPKMAGEVLAPSQVDLIQDG